MAHESLTVQLFNESYPTVRSHLSASIDGRGLVISGHDTGPAVLSIWGDSDYEYWLVVEREHLTPVVEGLVRKLSHDATLPEDEPQRHRILLELMELAWSRGVFETDVDFRRWLNAIHVPSEFSSYV